MDLTDTAFETETLYRTSKLISGSNLTKILLHVKTKLLFPNAQKYVKRDTNFTFACGLDFKNLAGLLLLICPFK